MTTLQQVYSYELALQKLESLECNFKCGICQKNLKHTHCVSGCLHRFCRKCIKKQLDDESQNRECPVCRVAIPNRFHVTEDGKYDLLVNKLLATKKHLQAQISKIRGEEHEIDPSSKEQTEEQKRKAAAFSKKSALSFNDRVKILAKFKEAHGHCNVPKDYKEDPSLARWVVTVRYCYHQRLKNQNQRRFTIHLNEEKIKILEEMGFPFTIGEVGVRQKLTFDDRVASVMKFKEIHGHCDIPKDYEGHGKLGNWIYLFKKNYALWLSGERCHQLMNEERVQKLKEAGVDIIPTRSYSDRAFETHMQELVKFKNKHGHYNVHYKHPSLGPWVSSLKRSYNAWMKGEKGHVVIGEARAKRLRKMGIPWALQKPKPKPIKSGRTGGRIRKKPKKYLHGVS